MQHEILDKEINANREEEDELNQTLTTDSNCSLCDKIKKNQHQATNNTSNSLEQSNNHTNNTSLVKEVVNLEDLREEEEEQVDFIEKSQELIDTDFDFGDLTRATIESSLNILQDLTFNTSIVSIESQLAKNLREQNIEELLSETISSSNFNRHDLESAIHSAVHNIFNEENLQSKMEDKDNSNETSDNKSSNRQQQNEDEKSCDFSFGAVSSTNSAKFESTVSVEKLKIQSIVEAVGFILFPSAGYLNLAFKDLLIENNLFEIFQ